MSQPQPTDVLVKRLQRVAQWIDRLVQSEELGGGADIESLRARANTCWQVAGRLEDLARGTESDHGWRDWAVFCFDGGHLSDEELRKRIASLADQKASV